MLKARDGSRTAGCHRKEIATTDNRLFVPSLSYQGLYNWLILRSSDAGTHGPCSFGFDVVAVFLGLREEQRRGPDGIGQRVFVQSRDEGFVSIGQKVLLWQKSMIRQVFVSRSKHSARCIFGSSCWTRSPILSLSAGLASLMPPPLRSRQTPSRGPR